MATSKRRWLLVAAALVVVVLVAIGVMVGIAVGKGGESPPTTPTAAAPAGTASPTPTGDAVPVQGAAARGCLIGNPPTTPAFTQLRASKDFTPTGAAEFLGAFSQLIAYTNPNFPAGALDAAAAASTGDVRTLLDELQASGGNGYSDSSAHAVTLQGGKYQIVSSTADQVVVAMYKWQIKDGVLETSDEGNNVRAGGTYTLEPTDAGWVVAKIDAGDADSIEANGIEFADAC